MKISPLDKRLYAISLITDFANALVIFAISRALAGAEVGSLLLGAAGATHGFAYGLSSMYGGRLADRFDRRNLMAAGMVVSMVGATGCYLFDMLSPVCFVAYAVFAVGPGLLYPALIAWLMRDESQSAPRKGISRALILFCVAWNLGIICGQTAGGAMFDIDPRSPILLGVALTAVNLCVLTSIRREPAATNGSEDEVIPTPDAVARRSLSAAFMKLAWTANVGATFSMGMMFHLFPEVAVAVDVPANRHGMMLAVMRSMSIAMYVIMYRTAFWHHRFSVALISQAIAALGLVGIAIAQTPAGLMLGMLGLAQLVGYNYFSGLYYSTSGTADDARGSASGMHEATLSCGIGAGSVIGGVAGQLVDPRMPYKVAAAFIVALACVQVVIFLRETRHRAAEARA
jgi:ENTS family enterobactin (siderophore) exporter